MDGKFQLGVFGNMLQTEYNVNNNTKYYPHNQRTLACLTHLVKKQHLCLQQKYISHRSCTIHQFNAQKAKQIPKQSYHLSHPEQSGRPSNNQGRQSFERKRSCLKGLLKVALLYNLITIVPCKKEWKDSLAISENQLNITLYK